MAEQEKLSGATIAEFTGPRFQPGQVVYVRAKVVCYTQPKPGEFIAWVRAINKDGNPAESENVIHYIEEAALVAKDVATQEVKGGTVPASTTLP
jgi:hypothetical protein